MGNKLVVFVWWLAALSIACSEGYPLLSGTGADPDDATAAAFDCPTGSDCAADTHTSADGDTGWDVAPTSCQSMVTATLIDSLDEDALWMDELHDDVHIGDSWLDLSIPAAKNMTEAYNWPAKWGAWTRILLREQQGLRLEFQDETASARFMLLDKCPLHPVENDVLARGLNGIDTGNLQPGVYYLATYADLADDLFASAHFIESESCDSLPLRTIDELSEPYLLTLQGQAGDFFVNESVDSHLADVAVSIDIPESSTLFPATIELVISSSGSSFPYELALLSDCETETELLEDEDWYLSDATTDFVPAGGAIYAGEYSTYVVLTAEIESAGVYQLVIKSEDDGRYNWGRISLTGRFQ